MLESSLLAPGNILGNRYEIVRELGRGGFGRSCLAIDLNKFREKCVLKEFAPQVRGQDELIKAKELFEREAGVLYKLQHPQIPAFRELLRVNEGQSESLLLVQDYIEGETYLDRLNHRLPQQLFSEGEVVKLLHNLLPVLDYIHRIGVIHRDISPDNIIQRDRDGLPVLIDFGCVKEIAATVVSRYSNAKVATRIGKQGYAPDEQMLRGKVSPSSDLYAVAATALTLLTGKDASAIYNPAEATWEWRKYVNLSPELGAIIDRLLQHHPHQRYQSAAAVIAVLPPLSNNTAPSSPPPAPANGSVPLIRANKISQLKTIEISPRNHPAASLPNSELSTRDPNEWKKPAWQVTKLMTVAFFTCLGISGIVKWAQTIDPTGAFKKQFNDATTSIIKSIPNPLQSQPATTQQSQQDFDRKLKQLNIPSAKFYRQVDREFYAKHPELNNRSLTNKAEDNKLRQEWQDLANELLAKSTK
jgi:serine/threonine protein kinase, bacterial